MTDVNVVTLEQFVKASEVVVGDYLRLDGKDRKVNSIELQPLDEEAIGFWATFELDGEKVDLPLYEQVEKVVYYS